MDLDRNIFIDVGNIYLRALREEDISGNYQFWFNDQNVVKFNSHGRFPMTPEKLSEYVKTVSNLNNALVLAIVDKQSRQHIGNISLQNINWIDRNAEIAFILGESDFWGNGIMQKAGAALINHGFNSLNLHRIYCGTSADNISMQKLAEKLDMKSEGVRKEAIFKNGVYVDMFEYGIINRK